MTVQELIDELNKIEDKSKIVTIYQEGSYPIETFDIYDGVSKIELM